MELRVSCHSFLPDNRTLKVSRLSTKLTLAIHIVNEPGLHDPVEGYKPNRTPDKPQRPPRRARTKPERQSRPGRISGARVETSRDSRSDEHRVPIDSKTARERTRGSEKESLVFFGLLVQGSKNELYLRAIRRSTTHLLPEAPFNVGVSRLAPKEMLKAERG